MRWIILALFVVPIIEVMLFVTVGGEIGLWATLGIIVATAAIGSWLLSVHGRGLPQRIQQELQSSGFPAQSLFEGLCSCGRHLLNDARLLHRRGRFFTVPAPCSHTSVPLPVPARLACKFSTLAGPRRFPVWWLFDLRPSRPWSHYRWREQSCIVR